jgi:hypothetical protein
MCILPYQLLNAWTNLYEIWYVYHDTSAHLNGVFHIFIHQSVCMYMYPPIVARQQIGKNFPAATNNCWSLRFLCGPWRIKGKQEISSCQKFLLLINRAFSACRMSLDVFQMVRVGQLLVPVFNNNAQNARIDTTFALCRIKGKNSNKPSMRHKHIKDKQI